MAPRKAAAPTKAPVKRKPRPKAPVVKQNPPASVLEALERELARMPESVRESSTALAARKIASNLDNPFTGTQLLATLSKELRELRADLIAAVADAGDKGDAVDELRARREARRAAAG